MRTWRRRYCIYLKVDGCNELFLGILSKECPQIKYDLAIEKGFELYHNSERTSVYFLGFEYPPDKGGGGRNSEESEMRPATIRVVLGKFLKRLFWRAEVKAGETTCKPEKDGFVLLTRAVLRESEGDEQVVVYVEVDGVKSVLGVLSAYCIRIACYLGFNSEFKLSHSSGNSNVFFLGYQEVEVVKSKLVVKQEKLGVGNADVMKVDSAAKKATKVEPAIANEPKAKDEDEDGVENDEVCRW